MLKARSKTLRFPSSEWLHLIRRFSRPCGETPSSSNRLELLERLAARVAVAHAAARGRAEEVLELRVGRAAVRAAEAALQLDELQRLRAARRRRREAGSAELLASLGRDAIGRPRVVEHDVDVRLRAKRAHLLG